MRTIANARLPERKIESADSPNILLLIRNFSIATDETTAAIIAAIKGLILRRSPIATPARETWDKVSAIKEYRLKTRKIPIRGAITAMMIPASNPLIMKL